MALTSADLARLGPAAQKQVLDKLAGTQKPKKSKYGNRKVVRDGIKFDSEREAARFGELKVLRAMGKIRDLRLQAANAARRLSRRLPVLSGGYRQIQRGEGRRSAPNAGTRCLLGRAAV